MQRANFDPDRWSRSGWFRLRRWTDLPRDRDTGVERVVLVDMLDLLRTTVDVDRAFPVQGGCTKVLRPQGDGGVLPTLVIEEIDVAPGWVGSRGGLRLGTSGDVGYWESRAARRYNSGRCQDSSRGRRPKLVEIQKGVPAD